MSAPWLFQLRTFQWHDPAADSPPSACSGIYQLFQNPSVAQRSMRKENGNPHHDKEKG